MSANSVETSCNMANSEKYKHECILIRFSARSLGNESSSSNTIERKIWQPMERSRSEWMACNGMPEDVCERTRIKYQQLQETLGVKAKVPEATDNRLAMDAPVSKGNILDGCILWSEEQIDMLMAEAKKSKDATLTRRKKRTMTNLKNNAYAKWPMPVHFKFDGTQEERQKTTIRNAFQHWMDNTCVRFNELATDAPFDDNHILMTSENSGCYSYVGRQGFKPQPINLEAACLIRFGTPVHEIGHTLGLWHEQMRTDRDSGIRVVWENLNQNYVSQFSKMDTDSYGVPYNYGSVMQYSSKEGVSINGGDTMVAVDPLYQMNMGQRTGLSFEDIKIINLAYCSESCSSPLSQPCQRGGYQNPNNCSTCTCPDGFSGQYCDQVAPSKYATCGGVINIDSGSQQVIKSPGYDSNRYYYSYQECSWWIKAPENTQLQLTFDGDFGLYNEYDACYHWVEIKYKKDLGLEGGRFCGYRRPNVTVISQSNEMMVLFRSNYSVEYYPAQRGFQVIVTPIPTVGNNPVVPTVPTPTSTTTSTSTTTTTSSATKLRTTPAPTPITSPSTPTTTPTTTSTTTPTTTSTTTPTTTSTTSTTRTSKTTTPTTTPTTTSATTPTTTTFNKPTPTQVLPQSTVGVQSSTQQSLWKCSFETTSSGDSLCGMTQDTTDQFDWTVFHDPTPSDPTGPDFPYDGNFYIYIEASEPRMPNDEARLFFPRLNFAGEVCVDFYYHMFGFHIDTLKLVRITESQSTVVWIRSGQIGNLWLHASVGVNLSTNSQLQFVGIRGNEFSGDIGLDKIEVSTGPCPV